jgi:flavin-dependent dehydrogenase
MTATQSFPASCEVLVVGAGPAGSACAQMLAHAGFDVLLADQQDFPRDKTCGDGLIPDAHKALARLGVLAEVLDRARVATHVGCVGPRGGRVDVPGTLAVLPRRELDDIVRRAALAAGAHWLAPARFEAPLEDAAGRVAGAVLRLPGGASHRVQARWTVLATGAVPTALIAAGMCERRVPSGVALRGYVKNEAMAGRITSLEVVWHRALRRGYGWIFPCPGGVFNIGVGLTQSHSRRGRDGRAMMLDVNLREVFADFTRSYAPAAELVRGGAPLGGLKGAPLRCSLEGARWTRPGLLVTGEAAGSTYSFTGEGIGKALETGIEAAQAIREGRERAQHDEQVRAAYEAALAALKPRFAQYEKANRINDFPWLADLVIWRAQRSELILGKARGVLEETSNPANLITPRNLLRLTLPLR